MIRFGYLSKNDGPAQNAAGDWPSPISPMRRVLNPFGRRRRNSIDHPQKLNGKELIEKDPHLGKTVEVTPMEDDDTVAPVIKPSLTYEFEDSSSSAESSKHPAPQKVQTQQRIQKPNCIVADPLLLWFRLLFLQCRANCLLALHFILCFI